MEDIPRWSNISLSGDPEEENEKNGEEDKFKGILGSKIQELKKDMNPQLKRSHKVL